MKKTMSCLYYSFLKTFDKRPEGFTIKNIVTWYANAMGEGYYPYEFSLDIILGNWEKTTGAARIQAIKIATDIKNKLASLAERSPKDGTMQFTGEYCEDVDGALIEVYESNSFPGGEPREVLPHKYRRKVICKGEIYNLVNLSDIAMHEAKTGGKSKIQKIKTFADNKRKEQEKESRHVGDVLGVGESELDDNLIPMAKNVLALEAKGLNSVTTVIDSVEQDDGAVLAATKKELLVLNTKFKELTAELEAFRVKQGIEQQA